ncbi:hypothetical protein CYMTET_39540 [Cymbomonas tetramitiformis]|uniref:peptidylprolyl isomerase n=1 Tax=Cymbomonas tetramitiformis TaxID=36881 RepID=A0AAE0C9V9_9CHLO|nr:hypothetical protein CYMTET_39540 [Cymbomonas tetramitiformis]
MSVQTFFPAKTLSKCPYALRPRGAQQRRARGRDLTKPLGGYRSAHFKAEASSCERSVDTSLAGTHDRLRRRECLTLLLATGAFVEEKASAEAPPPPETLTSPLGVRYQIISEGSGDIKAQAGDYVTFDYVLRRSNGYFVYSTTGSGSGQQEPTKFARNYQEEPVTFLLGEGKLIAGLEDVLNGRTVGSRVRALVPPEAGYLNNSLQPQPPSFGPKRELASHSNQPLFFEVEVRKVVSK